MSKRTMLEDFISGCRKKIPDNNYDYSRIASFSSMRDRIELVCPIHGAFEIVALKHYYSGQGCARCGQKKKGDRRKGPERGSAVAKRENSRVKFVERAREIHGDLYDYSKVVYRNTRELLTLVCPKHGEFQQYPWRHLSGRGCQSCGQRSSAEEEIAVFLEGLGVELIRRDRQIVKPKELDIVIPSHGLAIEYCGLYWHSERGRTEKNVHLEKHLLCEKAGYRLITIFEDEWLEHRPKVEATLRHFIGKSPKGVFGRDALISEIGWKEAKGFLARHHLLGSGIAPRVCVGARDEVGELIAVMSFGAPSDERGATGEIEMKRYVSDGRNHPGLGSRMFKWAIDKYGWTRVVAFVDRRWFAGSFKLHSGFRHIGESEPTVFWTKAQRRFQRRAFKKPELAKKHGPGLTKPEMMRRDGYSRIWDCGKLKFEWTAGPS